VLERLGSQMKRQAPRACARRTWSGDEVATFKI
jgi:hypothetical protein